MPRFKTGLQDWEVGKMSLLVRKLRKHCRTKEALAEVKRLLPILLDDDKVVAGKAHESIVKIVCPPKRGDGSL